MGSKRNSKKRKTNQRKSKPKSKVKKQLRKSETKGRKSRRKSSENEKILENKKRFEDEEEDDNETEDDFDDEEEVEEKPVAKQKGRRKRSKIKTKSSDSARDEGKGSISRKSDPMPNIPVSAAHTDTISPNRYALDIPKAAHTTAEFKGRDPSPLIRHQKSQDSRFNDLLDRQRIDRFEKQNAFQRQKSPVYGPRNVSPFHSSISPQQYSGHKYGAAYDYARRWRVPETHYSSNLGQQNQLPVNRNQYSKEHNFSYGSRQRPNSYQNVFKKGNHWPTNDGWD